LLDLRPISKSLRHKLLNGAFHNFQIKEFAAIVFIASDFVIFIFFDFWPSVGRAAGWPAVQSAQKRVSAWCEPNLFHSLSRDVIFCSPLVPFFLLQLKHEPNSQL
jgi:hypothetical protein